LAVERGHAAQLSRLHGIGLTFATVLGDEAFFRDFHNRRGIARVVRDQDIAKSGNSGCTACASSQVCGASDLVASAVEVLT
jgi:hypothetical protein